MELLNDVEEMSECDGKVSVEGLLIEEINRRSFFTLSGEMDA